MNKLDKFFEGKKTQKEAETPNIDGRMKPVFKNGDVVGFRNLDEYGEPTGRVFTQEEVREAQRKRDRKQGLNTDSE